MRIMEEADKAQLATSVKHLQLAVDTARAYLHSDQEHTPEVLQIHINFIVTKIGGVDKAVTHISRRIKADVPTPEETEFAAELGRDLQIRQAELLRQRKDQERAENAAALAIAATKEKASSEPQVQVVIKKPPLPPLPIPRFAGDPLEFANFIAIFDETVHKNDTLVASQKLVYLQSYVDGEAKKLIGKILITDANYETARSVLQANFGHSSQTISVLYDKLHNVQRSRNDPFSIRETHNEVESILQMLENIGVEVNSDQYLRYEVMKKWPFALVKQLVRTTDMSLLEFRAALKAEVQLQIQLTQATGYVQPSERPKPYSDKPSKYRSTGSSNSSSSGNFKSSYSSTSSSAPTRGVAHSGTSADSTRPSGTSSSYQAAPADKSRSSTEPMPTKTAHCPFCADQHHAEQCDKYKSAQQRLEKLGNQRCKKCFRQNHEGTPCIRNMKCRYCSSWDHNRALCPEKYPDQDSKCLFTDRQRKDEDPTGLFMTLLVTASNPSTLQKTGLRVLVDPACNRTALTERAAAKLGVTVSSRRKKPSRGMGDMQVEAVTEEAATVLLHTKDDEKVPISVRLTTKIADDVPVYNLQKFREAYPQCANQYIPPTGEGCPIDLILGSDHMIRLLTLHNSIYVDESCQLLSTKFGHLIMAENTDQLQQDQALFTFFTRSEDIVKLMWDLDLVGLKALNEPDAEYEERALRIFTGQSSWSMAGMKCIGHGETTLPI